MRAMLEDRILFIDAEAIVLDKPAGLPVDAPRRGGDSIASRLDELRCGFQRPPTPMHRLDTDTSGCLLFARTPKARAAFQQAFEARRGRKILSRRGRRARSPRSEGMIDMPLGQDLERRGGLADGRAIAHGLEATTHWRRHCRPRRRHFGRVSSGDRAHAPDPRPRPRGVRARDRRRPGLRRSRRADAAPRVAAGRPARRASRRST